MKTYEVWEGKMANSEMRAVKVARCGSLLAAAAVLLAVMLAGCGSERPVKYYEINYPPPAAAADASGGGINASVLVRTFMASHLYREDPIVYSTGPEEMGTYLSHRWVEPPTELLQGALVRGLRATGTYKSVTNLRSD